MSSKISKKERDALKWVRDALMKRNNLKPIGGMAIDADRCLENNVIPPKNFRMNTICYESSCGTLGCIGGWMGLKMHGANTTAAYNYVDKYNGPLYDLFFEFPDYDDDRGRPINLTRADVVKAINRVLSGKYKNPWKLKSL